MSVVVYIEHTEGKIKKGALEAVSYAKATANNTSGNLVGVVLGSVDQIELEKLSSCGIGEVQQIACDYVNHQVAATALEVICKAVGAKTVVISGSWQGKGISPRLAAKLSAGIITEAVSAPENGVIKRKAFSGKAFVTVEMSHDCNVICIAPNSFGVHENTGSLNVVAASAAESDNSLSHVSFNRDTSKLSLTDAELVVSAGRGLKAAENWGMIEELADELGAATACSKPVSDAEWRPHHEHVGQTGITISPNLYIAVGISGAIQHLAGVSSSKKIVVINTDPEAPFFKAADYGIVGDAFDVIPKLTAAIRQVKG